MVRPLNKLRVSRSLAALIRGLHPQLKRKVRVSLRAIVDDPSVGKPLRDNLEGLWSYRVSRFRIIYRVPADEKVVELVAIGPRVSIYQETLRLIRRDHETRS